MNSIDQEVILSNLRHMAEIKAPVSLRVPLIPGFNADAESLAAIARFVAGQPGLSKQISLFPCHTISRKSEYTSLGRPYAMEGEKTLTPEQRLGTDTHS